MPFTFRVRSGFTLIELLVVVSIIALLIGILLPAVGETRRQGRISVCTANMKQHGQATANFAAQNSDYMPHAPLSNAKDAMEVMTYGPRGAVAFRFASGKKPLNGFSFTDPGIQTFVSPNNNAAVVEKSETWANLQGWNGYFVFLSEYMTDGEGAQALSDVLVSPSDTKAKTESFPAVRKYLRENQGQWWDLAQTESIGAIGTASVGSYRYVPAAMTSAKIYSVDTRGTPLTQDYNLQTGEGPVMTDAQKARYVQRNPLAGVDYPSNKVLFWMWGGWHNSGKKYWCEESVNCTLSTADGGARAVVAARDGLAYIAPGDAARAENAGPMTEFTDPRDSEQKYVAHFWLTNGGIKGRDLN